MLNGGKRFAEVARHFGISENTWCRWNSTYSGAKAQGIKGLRELEAENRKLTIMVADQAFDIAMLKQLN